MPPRYASSDLPTRLKDDSIIEVVCEIRFDSNELEEAIVGRIVDWAEQHYPQVTTTRGGAAQLPAPMREADVNLRYQYLLNIDAPLEAGSTRKIRIGPHVFSFIVVGRYCGWTELSRDLQTAVDIFLDRVRPTSVVRAGLRYTNALTAEKHFVTGLDSLDVDLRVCNEPVHDAVNLNFRRQVDSNHAALVRIATPGFLQGQPPPDTTVVVDIDVSTVDAQMAPDAEMLKRWIEQAHTYEKIEFFSLLPEDLVKRLED